MIGENWNADGTEIKKVLDSAAAQILIYFPDRKLNPILVSHGQEVPITLDAKGPSGEYQVRLATGSTYWAQYSYQFAHELGHILCNYDRHHAGRNQWFEESLCETSSLFVLSRMGHAWKSDPPYPNWKDWGVHFDVYLNEILAKRSRRLPPDLTMPMWLKSNLPDLSQERRLTERSMLAATYLLPLFQDDPHGWECLNWLNLGGRTMSLISKPISAAGNIASRRDNGSSSRTFRAFSVTGPDISRASIRPLLPNHSNLLANLFYCDSNSRSISSSGIGTLGSPGS